MEERGRQKKRAEEGEQKGEAGQAEGGGKPRPKAKPTGSFKPGHPHYPRRPAPPRELTLKRRAIVSQLLAQGMPDRDIVSVCLDPERALDFGQAWRVHRLLAEIKDQWAHDDAEQAPRLKAMAVRRLLGSIQSARADKAWTAVASLERTLADIQGTREPVRIEVDVTAEQRHAIAGAIATMQPAQVLALAERMRELKSRLLPPAAGPVIEAEAVDVNSTLHRPG